MQTESVRAILLLGHGSRAPKANVAIRKVAEHLRLREEYPIVEVAFLQLSPPSIEEGMATCVSQGATSVLMLPYFLHFGLHVQEDLPSVVDTLRGRYPGVEITLGHHIGFHPKLVEIVVERVQESERESERESEEREEIASLKAGR
ncbi:MAG: CbiX/SirB N-terminal domain-containing protein [Firmicutes bacterium]|nr:CbiX/SirB N-terminal domain-containing protein [Bacillota bacterium]